MAGEVDRFLGLLAVSKNYFLRERLIDEEC